MNVFIISNMYPTLQMPGYGVFVKNVVDGITQYDINIVYSALIKGKGKNIFQKLFKYLLFYVQIVMVFFKTYDVIYIHYPNQALPVLLPLLFIKKKKIIVNLHGEDLLYEGSGYINFILGQLNERFLKNVNLIIVPSAYFKNIIIDKKLSDENKIFISPSGGINKNIFYPIPKNRISLTQFLGYVGRIDEGKGWKEFVEAISILKINDDKIKGIIIGKGAMIGDLNHMIVKHNLSNIISVIEGVGQNELCAYYNQFDLLVFASSRSAESLGLVGIEAMACGIPVIGTNIGGIPSYLIDKHNGYLIDVDDINSIVSSVLNYQSLSDSDKNKMKINCLKTAEKYFSNQVIEELSIKIKATILNKK